MIGSIATKGFTIAIGSPFLPVLSARYAARGVPRSLIWDGMHVVRLC